ncbi:MAG: hypothetical protein IPG12_17095 [Saprospiraceae bacterium]|nr:hypothetical protein [Saprospiraceae bacterium]
MDLNTDSTIILSQYGDTDREAKLLSLKAIWNKNIIEIEKFLKRYKIIQSIKNELNSFPIIINDEPFKDEEKIYLNNYTLLDAHDGESQRVKYGLHSTLRGDKIIYNKWIEYSPQSFDFTIIGYFISPFQKKIAILQQYTKKGSCGTIPRDLEFNFIGAQLDSGYSR